MTIFDEIAEVREKINKVQDKIEYLQMQADSPRSSSFSDMPKGSRNVSNPIEQYIIKKEKLEEKRNALNAKFKRLCKISVAQMNEAGINKQAQKMIYLRFACGLPWKECSANLNTLFPDSKWNVNKCFRVYREVLYKIPKNKAKTL